METNLRITFGPRTQFVPVCIRHKHGYYGGPVGYQEIRDPVEAKARGCIELREGQPQILKWNSHDNQLS